MVRHFNIPIFIPHVGCPFTCIFCNQKKIAATTTIPELRDIKEKVAEHLSTIPEGSSIEVAFFGGSFTAIDKDLQIKYLKVIQPYLKTGQVQSIRISTRPDFIDDNILKLLHEYGVGTIELGVQSLDDEVLKKSCRGYEVNDVFKAAQLIKENKFKLGIQLMVGLPRDNYNLDIKSTETAIYLAPDVVRIYPTLVIRDTYLATLYEKGLYEPLSLEEAVTITKEMYLRFISHNIKVIRMGLYPSEELISGDAVIAGPFHPAFGELVIQEVFYDQVEYLLHKEKINLKNKLIIYVNSRDISKMVGNHKNNIFKLKNNKQIDEVLVKGSALLQPNSIGVSVDGDKPLYVLSLDEYLEAIS